MLRVATFNAGLAVGVLPHVTERLPLVISALAELDVDLLFVQEFWLESHFEELCARLHQRLPHVIRQPPGPSQRGACTRQQLQALRECAAQHCRGLRDEALARCVMEHCMSVALSLPTNCLNCIASHPVGTQEEIFERCTGADTVVPSPASGAGGLKAYGGSFGTGLLLREPARESDSIRFASTLNARGAVWARWQPAGHSELHIFATHLSPGGREQEPQVEHLLAWIESKAGAADALLLGDLNTTPGSRLFQRFAAAGFRQDTPCRATFSSEGLLTGHFGESGWALDHVLVRGSLSVTTERILDQGVRLGSSEPTLASTLSDHAGLLAIVEEAGVLPSNA